MKLVDDIRSYVTDNEFKMIVQNKIVDILNFDLIDKISEDVVIVYNHKQKIKINGKSLMIKKLLNNELLITGSIISISFEAYDE